MTSKIYNTINGFTKTCQVKAGISLRSGGVSEPPYTSLNLASQVGDHPAAVIQNQHIFSTETGIKSLKYIRQIHSDIVINAEVITSALWNCEILNTPELIGDALISDKPGETLGVFTADCVPIFILDKATPAVGIVHAGWRGTLSQIVSKTLEQMKTCFGTNLANCLIHLGASIQRCCYTVNKDLISQFVNNFGDTVHDGLNLSLQTANYIQLIETGIRPECITISPICTSCRIDIFYSYRAEDGRTGRMLSYIQLNKTNED